MGGAASTAQTSRRAQRERRRKWLAERTRDELLRLRDTGDIDIDECDRLLAITLILHAPALEEPV